MSYAPLKKIMKAAKEEILYWNFDTESRLQNYKLHVDGEDFWVNRDSLASFSPPLKSLFFLEENTDEAELIGKVTMMCWNG